ncbi:tellurite resistance TerB family protein [Nonlabens antarcticus]|uniref:tellurite resistance TerB family protein n=1 Tax=Nonlabens antarcticus TaxID=392714 RepID=UPI0018918E09|nr:TerB family tellurite resistance protein [Nonlabens antarcticus]
MTFHISNKTEVLKELIAMAYADGNLSMIEIEYIKAVGTRLNFKEGAVKEMLEHPDNSPAKPDKQFMMRIVHFYQLMLMMRIDGEINNKELQLLHEIALRYGIRKITVNTLLEIMDEYPDGDIPSLKLLEIHNQANN